MLNDMHGKRGQRTLLGTHHSSSSFHSSTRPFTPPLVLLLLPLVLSLGLSFVLSLGLSLVLSLNRGVVFRCHRGVPALYSNQRGSRGTSGVRLNRRHRSSNFRSRVIRFRGNEISLRGERKR